MGQLAKQMIERPIGSYGANTEMNPKEECSQEVKLLRVSASCLVSIEDEFFIIEEVPRVG